MNWKELLKEQLNDPRFLEIKKKVSEDRETYIVYPPEKDVFNALKYTHLDSIKIIWLAQDPYFNVGQAHGLCFSVPTGIKTPPSLMNIYKEMESDLNVVIDKTDGNLEYIAKQGVLLLNSILTVRHSKPESHKDFGWQWFTDEIIRKISDYKEHVVFMLWGKFAQSKCVLIDSRKHLILSAPHPSPFSAHSGFFGCKHFSLANEWLKNRDIEPVEWIKK